MSEYAPNSLSRVPTALTLQICRLRTVRQVDCPDKERFPYQPSREERSTFDEYVFFGSDRNSYFTIIFTKAVPSLMALLLLLVNVGSISYNLYSAPFTVVDRMSESFTICGVEDSTNDC